MYQPRSKFPPPKHLTSSKTSALNRLDLSVGKKVFPNKPDIAGKGAAPATAQDSDAAKGQSQVGASEKPQTDAKQKDGAPGKAAEKSGGAGSGAPAAPKGKAKPAPIVVNEDDNKKKDAGKKGGGRKEMIFPPEPRLPMPIFPNMNAIRSPVVRPAPADAQTKARDITRDTGTSPSQHHANIQSAVFRVSEATRQAQRQLVQNVDSIATNTRWSIEEMAGQVDGIVARCAQVVSGAARRAVSEIDQSVAGHEATMRATAVSADEDMDKRHTKVSQDIINQLKTDGSDKMLAVHKLMGASFDKRSVEFGDSARKITNGERPKLLEGPGGGKDKPKTSKTMDETSHASTFGGEAKRLAKLLPSTPSGGGGNGGYTDPYYVGYIAFKQVAAMGGIGRQATQDWGKSIEGRLKTQTSVAAKNKFMLSMLGIVAPTAKAMKTDQKKFNKTLESNVLGNQREMTHAKMTALRNLKTAHFGVQNFFDPNNPTSMPAKVISGLHDSGALIKHGLMSQAKSYEANINASVSELAAAYPDLVDRLEAMLAGDDLMNADMMLPRIDGISDTVRTLLQGHLDMLRGQSRDALGQAREGFDSQTRSLWKTVDKTLGNITEQKLKSNFHFAMEEAMFTGKFTKDHIKALKQVSGYAEKTATHLLAPIKAGGEAGERVDLAVVDHFNRSLNFEYGQHAKAIGDFKDRIGYENPPVYNKASGADGKPLHQIHATEHARLDNAQRVVAASLPKPKTKEMIICGLGAVGSAFVTGGVSVVAGGFIIAGSFFAYSSMSKKSAVAKALGGLEWPGALAMNAIWNLGEPDARERIREKANEDADWQSVLDFFSTNKAVAVKGKSDIVSNAGWFTGINDDAIEAITKSMNDSERALLTSKQIKDMDASIRWNLTGLQEERTLAYLNGDRALALAIRFKEEMKKARREGDDAGDALGKTLARLVKEEMEAPGSVGHANPQAMKMLEDKMYVSLATIIPGPGNAERSVKYKEPAGAKDLKAATPKVTDTSDNAVDTRSKASKLRQQELLVNGLNAAYKPPNPADVKSAKAKVYTYATRDYAQFDSIYGQLFSNGHDHMLAEDIAAVQGFNQLPSHQTWDGRTVRGGLIIDPVRKETRKNIANFITYGATSEEYRQGLGSSILQTAGRSRMGTSQAEFVNLLNRVEDPRFNLAKLRYEKLRDDPKADPKKLVAALQIYQMAKTARDKDMIVMAREISGNKKGDMSIARARTIVSDRINVVARRFKPELVDETGSAGREIVENGRIGLKRAVDVATKGAGTYDDLLMQTTGGRHKSDIKKAKLDRSDLTVTDSWWTETSGDQAQQLEINLEGVPENDSDRLKIASMRSRHDAIDGTGYISALTMAGSWQKDSLHGNHRRLGERVQAAIIQYNKDNKNNPNKPPLKVLSPEELVPMSGKPHPMIADNLLDKNGNLIGKGPTVDMLATESAQANKSYRDEIARQESFFTGAITAIVVAVSVLLLFVPGVNVGAAAVLTALLGGAATIAVKAGMRGNRYGWEEAAVDVGRTAIEAATAGAGAAMGGAVKAGTPLVGKLATIGTKLEGALGKVGAAAAREGITNAVSGVAMTATDDRIWSKGFTNGMGELVKSGAKGAVTGVVSGLVSEGVTKGLNTRLNSALGEGVDTAIGVSARAGGANVARHAMLQEALSGLAGTTLSEAASISMDIADGKMRFNWGEIGKRLGTAGLREVLTGAARGRIQHMHRKTYQTEMTKIMRRGGDMTPAETTFMRRLAISAGIEQYGKDRSNENAASDSPRDRFNFTSDSAFADGVKRAAEHLSDLPPSIRSQVEGVSINHLRQIHDVYQRGAGALGPKALAELRVTLATMYPGLDPVGLIKGIETHRKANKAEAHASRMASQAQQGQHSRARNRVLQGIDPETRAALKDAPVSEIAALPVALQRELARVVAMGGDVDGIVAKARAAGEDVDAPLLVRQVEGLIAAKTGADADVVETRANRRKEVAEILPEGARDQIGQFSDKDIAFLHQLTQSGDLPAGKRKNLIRMLEARLKDVDGQAVIDAAIDTATTRRAAKTAQVDADARTERLKIMQHVPEDLRPLMSHLSESALLKIAYAQAGQMKLSKADIAALAKSATGAQQVDIKALTHAIGQTIRNRAAADQGGFFARVSQRRALLEFVPPQLRAMVKRTPMLTVPDELFFAYVKSLGDGEENAVTLRLGGEPVVLIREGAPRRALGEEGWHVVQMRDGVWSSRLADLDEEHLEAWPMMPAAEKARLARLMIEAEISAHLYMQGDLDIRAARLRDEGARARLASRQDTLTARIETLQRRSMELASLTPRAFAAMDKGRLAIPDWLARPARLFNEQEATKTTKKDADKPETDAQNAEPSTLTPDAVIARAARLKAPDRVGSFDTFHAALKSAVDQADPAKLDLLNDVVTLLDKVSGYQRDNAKDYFDGLTGLVSTVVKISDVNTLGALKSLLSKTDKHPMFLLNAFAQLNQNGVFGWFAATNQSAAGGALLKYLDKYLTTHAAATKGTTEFPSALEGLITHLKSASEPPSDAFWQVFKVVLDIATEEPKRTLWNNPKDGDILGHFEKAASRNYLTEGLSELVVGLSPAASMRAIKVRFENGYRPPVAPRLDYDTISKPLKTMAGKITETEEGSRPEITKEQRLELGIDEADVAPLIDLAMFLHKVHKTPPPSQNLERDLALSLANALAMFKMKAFEWGPKRDVSNIQPGTTLSFDDIKAFLHVTKGEAGANEKMYVSALPLFNSMLASADDSLKNRIFRIMKQFSHPNADVSFRIHDNEHAPRLTPGRPEIASDVSRRDVENYDILLGEGKGINKRWDQRRAESSEPDIVPNQVPTSLPVRKEGKVVDDAEHKVQTFEIAADASWFDFKNRLRELYRVQKITSPSDKDVDRAFVFLHEKGDFKRTADGESETITVDHQQSLKLIIRPDGTRSIYVGDGIKVTLKEPDAVSVGADTSATTTKKSQTPKDEASKLPVDLDIEGGDSYPGLINDILRDISNSKAVIEESAIDLLLSALADGSSLDIKGLAPSLVNKIKTLKAIAAGSEVLRDEMAAPALMLALYALKSLKSTKTVDYGDSDIHPSQIAFGHEFFKRTRVNTLASLITNPKLKEQMKAAGLTEGDMTLMNDILRNEQVRNQSLGGGLLIFTIPLFLTHRITAREFVAEAVKHMEKSKKTASSDEPAFKHAGGYADIIHGIIRRTSALVDLAILRHELNKNDGERLDIPNIPGMSKEERARIIDEIITEMMRAVLPELIQSKDVPDGT